MHLILALGNPGDRYAKTRHNVAWRVADELSTEWSVDTKLRAYAAKAQLGSTQALIAKPQTYMNLSGESARLIADYYKIPPENIISIYDDKDIPFGTIRLRETGGHGGHNGVRSLIQHLGEDFLRVKIGVSNAFTDRTPTDQFILGNFSTEEEDALPDVLTRAAEVARLLATRDFTEVKQNWREEP